MFDSELRDHLLIMKRYLPLIVGGALLIAAITNLVQRSATPVFEASSTVQVEIETIDDGLITDFQSAQFTQIMESNPKITAVYERAGLPDLSNIEMRKRLTVDQDSVPGFIRMTAQADNANEAANLANAAADVLVETIASSRAANINGSATTGSILEVADVPLAPTSPRPKRDAALAGLISLIVLAESSVLFTKIRGRVSLADPAGTVERATNVPTFTVDDDNHYNQAVMPLYVNSLAKQPSVVVVQRAATPSTAVASQIGNAASLVGRNVSIVDANLVAAQFVRTDPAADFTVASVTAVSNDTEALLAVSRLPHAVVLVADPITEPMADIVELARTIPGVGGNLVGIILHQPTGVGAPAQFKTVASTQPANQKVAATTQPPTATPAQQPTATAQQPTAPAPVPKIDPGRPATPNTPSSSDRSNGAKVEPPPIVVPARLAAPPGSTKRPTPPELRPPQSPDTRS